MSVHVYIVKQDERPITPQELVAAVARAPHYELTDDGMVQVPVGGGESVCLELLESGALSFQMLARHADHSVRIVDAIRRFAGCIPDAVVDAEGEILDPLPWDGVRVLHSGGTKTVPRPRGQNLSTGFGETTG